LHCRTSVLFSFSAIHLPPVEEGEFLLTFVKRDAYLEQLKIRKDNGMIKIITGIRRCGKSFLLFVLFKKYLLESGVDNDHIIEIALDGIENEELRDPKKCYQYIKDAMKDDQKYYLLLDEVQFMPRFEEVLNSLLHIGNIDIYVTGSNSKFLSSDIVTEFRGRGDEIRIYPLSFAEFYAAFGGDYDDAWEEYMIYGGLPQVVQFSMERQKAEYLKNIFTNVYIKDVVERNKLRNVERLGRFARTRLPRREPERTERLGHAAGIHEVQLGSQTYRCEHFGRQSRRVDRNREARNRSGSRHADLDRHRIRDLLRLVDVTAVQCDSRNSGGGRLIVRSVIPARHEEGSHHGHSHGHRH